MISCLLSWYLLLVPSMLNSSLNLPDSKMGDEMTRPKSLRRRSSLEKIMYICNQGCQVFPHIFLRMHDFRSSMSADLRKIIPLIKALLVLRLGVYLSVCFLSIQLLCCLIFLLRLTVPTGMIFLLGCTGLLCLLAFQVFDVVSVARRKFNGTFFVKKKNY